MAMGPKRPEAEHVGHQPAECVGNLAQVETTLVGAKRETIAGHGRGDHGECIAGIAAGRGGMRQERNELVKFNDRTRPAVGQQQRQWRVALTLLVNEVQLDAIDRHGEVAELVERCLLAAPVVSGAPIVDEALQMLKVRSEGPV